MSVQPKQFLYPSSTSPASGSSDHLVSCLLEHLSVAAAVVDQDLSFLWVNQPWRQLFAWGEEDLELNFGTLFPETPQLCQPRVKHSSAEGICWETLGTYGSTLSPSRMRWQARRWSWTNSSVLPDLSLQGGWLLLAEPIPVGAVEAAVHPIVREQMIHTIATQIHQLSVLEDILRTTVHEIRQFLRCDRVVIYQLSPQGEGIVIQESRNPDWRSVFDPVEPMIHLSPTYLETYQQGWVHRMENIQTADLPPDDRVLLEKLQVKANLSVPIFQAEDLWGVLCVQQCDAPRTWDPDDIRLIQQLATHVGIAIQQTALREQLRHELQARDAILNAEIAERLRKETELQDSERRRSLLLHQTSLAVIEMTPDFQITAWNPAAERLFGYTAPEAIGRIMPELIVPETERAYVDEVMQIVVEQPGGVSSINENICKDGQRITCEWYDTALIDNNGQIIGIASMAIDITERKRAEAALQDSEAELRQQTRELEHALQQLQQAQSQLVQTEKMSSLGQLVAGIAHEINNPVNFIYGNIIHVEDYVKDVLHLMEQCQKYAPELTPGIQSVMSDIELDFLMEDFPRIIQSIKVGAERIRLIVQGLRNFSRLDEAEMKPVNIHEGIDSTLMLLQHRLKERPHQLGIHVDRHYAALPLVECYVGQLNQVFMNVLSNAIDAIDEQVVSMDVSQSLEHAIQFRGTITIATALTEPNWVTIYISDTGTGIPPSVQKRLFDPFFTTKAPGKGTGLGLSISYQIVTERHQGELSCTSVVGQGTTFTIKIPLQQSS